jgi:hypothetical protein
MNEKSFWEAVTDQKAASFAIGLPSGSVHCDKEEIKSMDEGTMCLVRSGNEVFFIDVQKVDKIKVTYKNDHGAKAAVEGREDD